MLQVSVIIPTYNRRELLARALLSVKIQEGVGAEIIVIDDGSTDGTEGMVRSRFPEAAFIRQENQGPSAARNSGIALAKAPWIAFLDSDDEWLPGKLKAQIDFVARYPDFRIVQTEEIWIRNGQRVNAMNKHRKFGGRIFEKCLPLCIISPSAVMLHRNLLEQTGGFDESLPACEDYDLWLRIACREPVGLIEKPYVVKYGGHADQRSREFPAMDMFRIRSLAKILRSGMLTSSQQLAARETLKAKTEIYVQGAVKRGKTEEAEELLRQVSPFITLTSGCLDTCHSSML